MNIFEFIVWACSGGFWRFVAAVFFTMPIAFLMAAATESLATGVASIMCRRR